MLMLPDYSHYKGIIHYGRETVGPVLKIKKLGIN
jgi:hypothetical protein